MLAVCCPRSALCEPYVGPMFAYVSRMWPQVGPMLALCWPKLALSCPYVGPILALGCPIVSANLPEVSQNTVNRSFFPFRGAPWTSKPRKTRGFLIVPRWNSGTAKATKHRKTQCFWTPWAEYTVNYKGSGAGEWVGGDPPKKYIIGWPWDQPPYALFVPPILPSPKFHRDDWLTFLQNMKLIPKVGYATSIIKFTFVSRPRISKRTFSTRSSNTQMLSIKNLFNELHTPTYSFHLIRSLIIVCVSFVIINDLFDWFGHPKYL